MRTESQLMYEAYMDAPVGNYLVAPAIAAKSSLVLNELVSLEEMRIKSRVLAYDETTEMALIDKRFPHSVKEVMWLHAGGQPIDTLSTYIDTDNRLDITKRLFGQMATCAEVGEEDGSVVALSWSSDPETSHRPSIQGEKRLHFHLTARDRELIELEKIAIPIGKLNFIDRRRIGEEYSWITASILRKIFDADSRIGIRSRYIHPCVYSFEIGDWNDLTNSDTIGTINHVINTAQAHYNNVQALMGNESEVGTPTILEPKISDDDLMQALGIDRNEPEIQLLGSYIHRQIICNSRAVNRQQPTRVTPTLNKNLATVLTPSVGMSYAGSFSRDKDQTLMLNLRFCKFSDLGGAGCAFIGGMPVRIKKGDTPMSHAEMAQRHKFTEKMASSILQPA